MAKHVIYDTVTGKWFTTEADLWGAPVQPVGAMEPGNIHYDPVTNKTSIVSDGADELPRPAASARPYNPEPKN